MTQRESRRADASAADRLIDAAEALYGEQGLAGVSLRQISVAAGSGNNYAVQYHFGDVAGLIRAILERRTPELERQRAQLLAEVKAQDRLSDSRVLMNVLYRPLIEYVDARGERTYARFLLALHSSPTGMQHASDMFRLTPIADQVHDLLHLANPEIPPPLIRERQRLIAIMVLTSIFNRYAPYQAARFDTALIDNALEMATAAITAPLSPAVQEMMGQIKGKKPGSMDPGPG
ncbi:TetR/AcrR family transcriptional regulator [Phenylobacterium sp. LjRoot225]|uniref:TetR/AcrR family transcriptional regulator n=1 Tax=Phenylobacterium sp. LjRoot225 TaxID=3342285 RepID=UPI003ECE7FB0